MRLNASPLRIVLAFALMLSVAPAFAQQLPAGATVKKNIEYANVDGHSLKLDLYMPKGKTDARPPLLVWIHGGGWRGGSKDGGVMLLGMLDKGYAVASINYRLSGVAKFPAGVHDCKGAIRWLRAHADELGYDATRIGVSGGSAGGHLVALLGVSGGIPELEGDVGGNTDQSSRVQAVVNFFGPTDFTTLSKEGHPEFTTSLVALWLDGPISASPKVAELASPVFHVTSDDAPLLTIQGTEDPLVFVPQAEALHKKYQAAGIETTLEIIEGGKHGGPQFVDAARQKMIADFYNKHIRGGR